jgi:hypothetical protein
VLGVQVRKGDEHGDPDTLADIYFDFAAARDRPELMLNHTPPGMVTFD